MKTTYKAPDKAPQWNEYIWQMNNGYWYIDQKTNWHLDGATRMPRQLNRSFDTESDARAAVVAAKRAAGFAESDKLSSC